MLYVVRTIPTLPIIIALSFLSTAAGAAGPESVSAALPKEKGCLSCHVGIERFSEGAMMESIEALGADSGDPGGCVVCHGGTPGATTKGAAHSGAPRDLKDADGPQLFYPDPGSVWIAKNTCGQCHDGYAERVAEVADEYRGRQAPG